MNAAARCSSLIFGSVFFSRITLEDKAGQQYEPYIFAALHSAKVMVVIGTRPEYMNAVWVKNEWSRYLALMKNDRGRLLIPCYRDMDPYDMPEQLSILQSYDMSRIGFIQDLIRGISKVLEAGKPKEKETVIVQTAAGNTTTLDAQIKRGNLALEDSDFQAADSYFDHALDIDPESAEAYFGKALSNEKCRNADQFIERHRDTGNRATERISVPRNAESAIERSVHNYTVPNYLPASEIQSLYKNTSVNFYSEVKSLEQKLKTEGEYFDRDRWISKAIRYAKGEYKTKLDNIRDLILSGIRSDLDQAKAADEAERQRIIQQYAQDFQRSEQEAWNKYNEAVQRREAEYQSACIEMTRADSIDKYDKVLEIFRQVGPEYRDTAARIEYLENAKTRSQQEKEREIQEIKRRKASERKRRVLFFLFSAIAAAAAMLTYVFVIKPLQKYNEAERLFSSGKYDDAIKVFQELGNYRDSEDRIHQAYYAKGDMLVADNNLVGAYYAYFLADVYAGSSEKHEKLKSVLSIMDIAAGGAHHTVRINPDGTVAANGANESGQCNVSDWRDIVSVAAGGSHTVGIKSDGTVVAVGLNRYGQCNVSDWRDIVFVSAGTYHTVGLKSDGTVVAVGAYVSGQRNVSDWRDIVSVAAGGRHTVGLKSDGTVVAVGSNSYGQLDVSGWRDIISVAAGGSHTVGLKLDGTVVAVGNNASGQLNVSDWRDIISVTAGGSHTVGLKSDGTVVAIGGNESGQCNVSDWRDIVFVAAGSSYTVGLKSDGTVVAVGDNRYGQCDVSDWDRSTD